MSCSQMAVVEYAFDEASGSPYCRRSIDVATLEHLTVTLAEALSCAGVFRCTLVGVLGTRLTVLNLVALQALKRLDCGFVSVDPTASRDDLECLCRTASLSHVIRSHHSLTQTNKYSVLLPSFLTFVTLEWVGGSENMSGELAIDVSVQKPVSEGGTPFSPPPRVWDCVPAYAMPTSGTTRKKRESLSSSLTLVVSPWEPPLANVKAISKLIHVRPGDRVLQVAPLSFDPCIIDMYMSLTCGATLVVVSDQVLLSQPHLSARLLEDAKITILQATPSFLSRLDAPCPRLPSLRCILSGGEALRGGGTFLSQAVSENPALNVYNLYGTTETSVWASCDQVHTQDFLREGLSYEGAVGKPLEGIILQVEWDDCEDSPLLDEFDRQEGRRREGEGEKRPPVTLITSGQEVSSQWVGRQGLLSIGGKGTACVVLDSQSSSEKSNCVRVSSRPFHQEVESDSDKGFHEGFRPTGDVVRVDAKGRLVVVGRKDFVIKVFGKRVSLEEAEAAIKAVLCARLALPTSLTAV